MCCSTSWRAGEADTSEHVPGSAAGRVLRQAVEGQGVPPHAVAADARRPASPRSSTVTVIRPTQGLLSPRIAELWAYRELFLFLNWRDLKVRYAQTALGAIWTFFQPVAMMLVFTYAFSRIGTVFTNDVPYPVFALSGLTVWIFVSRAVYQGATSLITNQPLVTKTSCPRLLIPLSGVTTMLVDFVISFGLFGAVALAYSVRPSWQLVFAPLVVVVTFVFVLGLALILAGLNVRYRDVGQALPFLIQLWFFCSPVAYTLPVTTQPWISLAALNPLVGLIEWFRWSTLGTPRPHGVLVVAIVVSFAWLAAGLVYFSRVERTFADDV